MIEMRRPQLSFGDGLIAVEVSDLREDWMTHADEVLADEEIVAAVYEALAKRHPKSRCRGRRGTPADVVLRLLILKHIRNWSYEVLEREARANLVYRDFTHVGGAKMPDAKTMSRWGQALGPEVLKQLHERIVKIAQNKGVTAGRRMRVDTTVVETDIHHLWRARRLCSRIIHKNESTEATHVNSIPSDLAVFRLAADSGQMATSLNFAPGSSLVARSS